MVTCPSSDLAAAYEELSSTVRLKLSRKRRVVKGVVAAAIAQTTYRAKKCIYSLMATG